jgi:hypothetical protein
MGLGAGVDDENKQQEEGSEMYTFTARWEGLKRAEVKGRVEHAFRDVVAEKEGRFRDHMNEGIDTARMNQNQSFVVGEDGEWKSLEDMSEFYDRFESVIGQAKRSTYVDRKGVKREREFRSDTSVMVEHILQLDPKFYDQWRDPKTGAVVMPEDEDEQEKIWHSINAMMEAWRGQVGEQNCLGATLHLDEKNPHLQLFSVPLTKDSELSYRKVYGGGSRKASQKKFSDIHDGYREAMRAEGYEIMHERVSRGRTHLHPDDYKKWRDQAEAVEAGAKEIEKGRKWLVETSRAQREEAKKIEADRADAEAQKAEAQKRLAEAETQAQGIVQKARESMAEELERLQRWEADLDERAQKQGQERLEVDQMKDHTQKAYKDAEEALRSAQRHEKALRAERAEVKELKKVVKEEANRLLAIGPHARQEANKWIGKLVNEVKQEQAQEWSNKRYKEFMEGVGEKRPWEQDGPDFG